ncbi:MAG TPA: PepSY domain-containing protein [Bacillota bacterium]|nr:PepSY domain-containing protein [Bacillota bacterium]
MYNYQRTYHHPYEQHWKQQHPHQYMGHSHSYRQITIEDAINIARQQVQGEVVKVELDSKGGMPIYEVDIVNPQGMKYEVKINIQSGEVIEVELD